MRRPCGDGARRRNEQPRRFGIRHNGAFELRWLNWIFTPGQRDRHAGIGHRAGANAKRRTGRCASRVIARSRRSTGGVGHTHQRVRTRAAAPSGTTPLKLAPEYEAWLVEAIGHGDNDAYWTGMGSSVVDHIAEYQGRALLSRHRLVRLLGPQVANLNYVELSKAKKSLQRLIVGPWTHGGQGQSFSGIAEFGPAAAVDMNAFAMRWFDRWLLGLQNGVDREPPVRIFVMGTGDAHKTAEGRLFVGGDWRDEREWPLARRSTRHTTCTRMARYRRRHRRRGPADHVSFDRATRAHASAATCRRKAC